MRRGVRFFQSTRVRKDINTIIFLGGSQGAKAINNFALQVAPLLKENGINIIHQSGKLDYNRVKEEYKILNIKVDLFDFTTNILDKMNQADFAVSRSGASTLWELTALGLPALYIPYPYAAANHQYFNAEFLINNNLCFLQTEDELNTKYFKNILKTNIEKISKGLIKSINKNGIQSIVDKIIA